METFTENFKDPWTLVTLIFIMATLTVFSNGSSYGSTLLIDGLGQLFLAPMSLLASVSGALPVLAPVLALAFLWFLSKIRGGFGEAIQAGVLVSAVILVLHA